LSDEEGYDKKEKSQYEKISGDSYNKVMRQSFGVEDTKMVYLVRHDLKMGIGKIGAQCGHATIGVF